MTRWRPREYCEMRGETSKDSYQVFLMRSLVVHRKGTKINKVEAMEEFATRFVEIRSVLINFFTLQIWFDCLFFASSWSLDILDNSTRLGGSCLLLFSIVVVIVRPKLKLKLNPAQFEVSFLRWFGSWKLFMTIYWDVYTKGFSAFNSFFMLRCVVFSQWDQMS